MRLPPPRSPLSLRGPAILRFAVLPVLAVAFTGCMLPDDGGPGLDNPKLVLYRTGDQASQIVVHGAFKEREYDSIEVTVDGALLANATHAYLATEKINRSAFDMAVRVTSGSDAYVWRGAILVLPDGLRVTPPGATRAETHGFPFVQFLEKEDGS